jgi:hypothetical protein
VGFAAGMIGLLFGLHIASNQTFLNSINEFYKSSSL